ncbi:MAG: hypothetical protein GY719_23260 [bacterium]|nr:hypothetical protein [bacterium]
MPWIEREAANLEPIERYRLERRLETAVARREYAHHEVVDVEAVAELEVEIREMASQLARAPEEAIAEAEARVAFDRIGPKLVERARFPVDPDYSGEAAMTRARYLEAEIMDLARVADPRDPALPVQSASEDVVLRAEGRGLRRHDLRPTLEVSPEVRERLPRLAGRVESRFRGPRPTQVQRVVRLVRDLGRIEQLEQQARLSAEGKAELLFGGNVYELRGQLERVRTAKQVLKENVEQIFSQPQEALEAMEGYVLEEGDLVAAELIETHPESFGELRGRSVLGWETGDRQRARLFARSKAEVLRGEWARRAEFGSDLSSAREYMERMAEGRELREAFPSRETLLVRLGQEMEGLEMHDLWVTLGNREIKMVRDLRAQEQQVLGPLLEVARQVGPGKGSVSEMASQIARLHFKSAPGHILRRMSAPQLGVVVAAVRVGKRMVSKSLRVSGG